MRSPYFFLGQPSQPGVNFSHAFRQLLQAGNCAAAVSIAVLSNEFIITNCRSGPWRAAPGPAGGTVPPALGADLAAGFAAACGFFFSSSGLLVYVYSSEESCFPEGLGVSFSEPSSPSFPDDFGAFFASFRREVSVFAAAPFSFDAVASATGLLPDPRRRGASSLSTDSCLSLPDPLWRFFSRRRSADRSARTASRDRNLCLLLRERAC